MNARTRCLYCDSPADLSVQSAEFRPDGGPPARLDVEFECGTRVHWRNGEYHSHERGSRCGLLERELYRRWGLAPPDGVKL